MTRNHSIQQIASKHSRHRFLCISGVALVIVLSCFGWRYKKGEEARLIRRETWIVRKAAISLSVNVGEEAVIYPRDGNVLHDGALIQCSLTSSCFVWKFPKNAKGPLQLKAQSANESLFYACSEKQTSDGRRVFVFSAPLYTMVLNDTDVDWETHRLTPGVKAIPF
jgi:hypothetical protein